MFVKGCLTFYKKVVKYIYKLVVMKGENMSDQERFIRDVKDEDVSKVEEIQLGDGVADKVTRFCGIVTGIAYYLNSEPAYQVEPNDDFGKTLSRWYAGGRLIKLAK